MAALSTWVLSHNKKVMVVGVADMAASNDPVAELVTYSLGSCLGVTVYDPVQQAGGLLHLMLPDSNINRQKAAAVPAMFVDTGLPRLFEAVHTLGGDRSRLMIKVAGGAQFLDPQRAFNIGERNYAALRAWLARNGYPVHAEAVGGTCSRTLRLHLTDGSVTVSSPGTKPYCL